MKKYTQQQLWEACLLGFNSFEEIDRNNPLEDIEQRENDLREEFEQFLDTLSQE